MSIAEQIDKDYIQAYKTKDQVRLGTLRLLKTAAKNRQVELMRPLEDNDYMDVLLREIKQRQDSIEQYTAAGRTDLAEKESAEASVLQAYLPAQLSEAELADPEADRYGQKDGQRRVRLDEVRELYTCKHNLSRFLR